MKKLLKSVLFATLLGSGVYCQTPAAPPPEPSPDTVIAAIDGRNLTYGELHSYISTLSEAQARNSMTNLEVTVKQYALLLRLSKMGEDQKLDQKPPYVDILRAGRMQVLAQAAITEQFTQVLVLPNEQEGYYREHKGQKYTKLKVKAIYVGFAANPSATSESGKKYRSEAQAHDFAVNLVAKIRAGADFVALVRQYSEDETSKKADGDWGTVNSSDNLPDDFKSAVLALKVGQITDPLRRTGGFYIFKADSMVDQPYSEVRDEIYNTLKDVKMRQWMEKLQQSIPVKVDPAALKPAGASAPPAGQ